MERGKLISLEGIDGVGKTTCASILSEQLNLDGQKCVQINRKSIPSGNEYIKSHMEYLYALLWKDGEVFSKAPNVPYNGFNREHWRHLMIAWYCAFEQCMILPVLEKGISVITDGYVYKEMVKAIYSTEDFETGQQFDFLYKPDIVFYLTTSPEECIRKDSSTNRIESGMFVGMKSDFVKHQNKMKSIYDRLALEKNWVTINRNKDVSVTCNEIMKALNECLSA